MDCRRAQGPTACRGRPVSRPLPALPGRGRRATGTCHEVEPKPTLPCPGETGNARQPIPLEPSPRSRSTSRQPRDTLRERERAAPGSATTGRSLCAPPRHPQPNPNIGAFRSTLAVMPDPTSDFRTGRHVVFRLSAHVVLTPKYRRKVITDRVRDLLVTQIEEVCARHGVTLVAADGTDDHLHLLIEYPPKLSLAKFVGAVKTNTSRAVRAQHWPEVDRALWGEHFWSPSYCVVSTGGASLETVKQYVDNQRRPGRKPGRPGRA